MAEPRESVAARPGGAARGRGRGLRLRRLLLGLLLLALLGEAALRVVGRTDENGQFWVAGGRVRPYALPLTGVRRALQELAGSVPTYLAPDPELGWTIRPGASSRDGLFAASAQGLRADRLYSPQPETGVL
ncbi:MAG TPA: hypothetical protein VFD43_05435, partial [Planctomycetota bacterium]|nr:hypothetical protein [Planctomycetota bacterium]